MEQPFRLGRRIITLKVRFEATLNSSQNESGTYRNHNTAGRKPTLIVKNVISFVRFDYIQSALMQMYDEPAWSNYATLPSNLFSRSMASPIGVQKSTHTSQRNMQLPSLHGALSG